MEEERDPPEEDAAFVPPGPEVSPELFRQWRSPRFGRANPERMDNPVWEWLIRRRANAFQANAHFNGPSPFEAGPCWCFDRLGQSRTHLPDGREILIGGEHEDSYDPDFRIYNDVVALLPDGGVEIYGYPRTVFPPTDFHSASLIDGQIVIIGCLGYPEDRRPDECPVFSLDPQTFQIRPVKTAGIAPGWLHRHEAQWSADRNAILIQRGKLLREDGTIVENIDDWQLRVEDWRWEQLTDRRWRRWEFAREDEELNHLWDIEQLWMERQFPSLDGLSKIREELGEPPLEEELGGPIDFDALIDLFRPPVEHESIPDDLEEYGVKRICVHGVVVRYVRDSYDVQMTVEGELDDAITDRLIRDLREKLARLEHAPIAVREL